MSERCNIPGCGCPDGEVYREPKIDWKQRALAAEALADLLNHGIHYGAGEMHEADPEKAKEILAAHAALREGGKK